MKRALTLLAPLLLAACATAPMMPPPQPPSVISASATVPLGDRATLDGLTITPLKLVEDSRCPINARCVWAGRLILRTVFGAGGSNETRDFTLGTAQAVPGGSLTLVGAEPGKLAGTQGNPPANLFTFELRN